ncbi:mitochondrial carrier domain-containing protein [Xylariaceae sp. FL0594]|nr:mitochondrial carrier domain-containing protein [Xylariaceae sp. FL0594]
MPSSQHNKDIDNVLPALHHASSGALGTLVSTCALYPLSLVIARLQVQRQVRRESRRAPSPHPPPPSEYAGIADAISQIWKSWRDGGVKALYTGLAQDAPKSVLDSFLFFLFYEWFRRRLRSRWGSHRAQVRGLGVVEEIAIGMAAGACSRCFTAPIANIVTRKQTATLRDPEGTGSVADIARSILDEKGITGFWSGYSASLVLTLNPSLTFFLQEFLKSTFADKQYDDPGPQLTFLFAASSKAVSSFVTYPFQVAKTRLQAGVPVDSSKDLGEKEPAASDEEVTCRQEIAGPRPIRLVKALTQQSTFGMVAHIVQSEGIVSLYDCVGAELLKGFFSHGITMVAKDAVHKLLFKLYLLVGSILAELRRRRLSMKEAGLLQMLPRTWQYRLDAKSQCGLASAIAGLVHGAHRPPKTR